MFQATMCPSSGENTVPTRHLAFVSLNRWLSGMRGTPHTRQSIYSDKCQVSHRYGILSWWWAHSCLKHVEKSNKRIKNIWHQVGSIYKGCNSVLEKNKKFKIKKKCHRLDLKKYFNLVKLSLCMARRHTGGAEVQLQSLYGNERRAVTFICWPLCVQRKKTVGGPHSQSRHFWTTERFLASLRNQTPDNGAQRIPRA